MTDFPIKPSPGTGVLKGTAYFVIFLLTLPNLIDGFGWWNANQTFHVFGYETSRFVFTIGSGYLLACLLVGWLCKRFGTGTVLLVGALLSGIATLGYAIAPTWGVVEALGLLRGTGSGLIFTGLVIHFVVRFGTRALLRLFAYYSATGLIMSLLITLGINNSTTWQSSYLIATIAYGIVVMIFAVTRRLWNMSWFSDPDIDETIRVSNVLGLRFVWVALALLLLAGGLETVVYSFWGRLMGISDIGLDGLTVWRNVSVVAQFASLTILIMLVRRIADWRPVIWICTAGVMVGAGLATWGGTDLVRYSGNTLMTLFIAPLLPVLLMHAKNHIPQAFLPMTIGWLIAASSIGGDFIGRLLGTSGSTTINMTVIFALVVFFIGVVEIGVWLDRSKKKKLAPEIPEVPNFLPEER